MLARFTCFTRWLVAITNVWKVMCNNSNPDLVNINAFTKFGEILSRTSDSLLFNLPNFWKLVARIIHYLQLIFVLKSDPYILCSQQNKSIWKILHINIRTSWWRGRGYFMRPNFISQKVKDLPGTHLNTRKYSVCGIKLEMKVISLT